ncbi:MAG: ABC transporter substrate-binding protein, partial [Pseudomonadales bacterium]|nr:ABC transporter substrate-binding protein [Pseudomonadales bacterium]
GSVVSSGYQIWNNAPEKILGVTAHWHQQHPATHLRLRMALMEACHQLGDPAQRLRIADIMSAPGYLNLPVNRLLPSLSGNYCFSKGTAPVSLPDFHVFGRHQAGFPWRSQAQWMVQQTSALIGKAISTEQRSTLVQSIWRTDLYREAARALGIASPSQDFKTENRHDSPWYFEEGLLLGPDRMLL